MQSTQARGTRTPGDTKTFYAGKTGFFPCPSAGGGIAGRVLEEETGLPAALRSNSASPLLPWPKIPGFLFPEQVPPKLFTHFPPLED